MAWKGKFFGALIGFLITRNVWGAVMGAVIGHMFDESAGFRYANSAYATAAAQAEAAGAPTASVSEVFFRTTFELMGHVAKSDGRVSEAEIDAARRLMARLGISGLEFAHMEAALRVREQRRWGPSGRQPSEKPLAASYAELEVGSHVSDQEVIKAYRRQMSRHHPDKLVANGLPESMAQVAKEKTQRIQEAYEAIRAARGMR